MPHLPGDLGCGEAQPPIPTFANGGHLKCDAPIRRVFEGGIESGPASLGKSEKPLISTGLPNFSAAKSCVETQRVFSRPVSFVAQSVQPPPTREGFRSLLLSERPTCYRNRTRYRSDWPRNPARKATLSSPAILFTNHAAPCRQALVRMLLHPLGELRRAHQAGLHRDVSEVRGGDGLLAAICRR